MRTTNLVTLASIVAALVCLSPSSTQAQVRASLVAAEASVQPSRNITVALRLDHEPHWHSYWINAGTGYPTRLEWALPTGWKATGFQWPTPSLIKDKKGDVTGHGYDGVIYLPLTVTAPANAKTGESVTLQAKASWLMCNEVCVPGSEDVSLTLPVAAAKPAEKPAPAAKERSPSGIASTSSRGTTGPATRRMRSAIWHWPGRNWRRRRRRNGASCSAPTPIMRWG